MSAAHLHAVPDPDDVPASAPAGVATAPGEGAAVVELLDAVPAPTAPPEDVEEVQAAEAADELEDAEEPGEYPDEEESGEEDVPPRAFALPDLRPYVTADRETARELRSLAADVTRTTAPRVRRGLAPVVRGLWKIIRAGAVVVLLALRAWFSGELAPKVPPLWRIILGPLITCAAVFQTVVLYPWAPLLLVPAWPLLALIVQRWASVQADRAAKAKASGKGGERGREGLREGLARDVRRAPHRGPRAAPRAALPGGAGGGRRRARGGLPRRAPGRAGRRGRGGGGRGA